MAKSIASIIKEAGQRLEKHDFGSALQLYQQAMTLAPNNAGVGMGLAMVFNRVGKPAEALGLLQRIWSAMTLAKPKPKAAQQAAVLAQLGFAQEQLGRIGEALESYRQAGRLVQAPELEQLIKKLEPLAASPVAVQQLVLNARRLKANGQLQEAGNTYQAALKLQPDNAEVLHGLAHVMRELGAPGEALPLLQKAVILAPERADYFNDLGLLFQDRSDFTKAISFHKRALKVDPHFVSAQINLGVAYKRLGKMAESEAAYQSALELDPRSPQAHNNLGNLLRVLGRLTEARKHLSKALALQPGYADAQANLEAVLQAMAEAAKRPSPVPAAPTSGNLKARSVKAKPAPAAAKPGVSRKPAARKVAATRAMTRKAAVR